MMSDNTTQPIQPGMATSIIQKHPLFRNSKRLAMTLRNHSLQSVRASEVVAFWVPFLVLSFSNRSEQCLRTVNTGSSVSSCLMTAVEVSRCVLDWCRCVVLLC